MCKDYSDKWLLHFFLSVMTMSFVYQSYSYNVTHLISIFGTCGLFIP